MDLPDDNFCTHTDITKNRSIKKKKPASLFYNMSSSQNSGDSAYSMNMNHNLTRNIQGPKKPSKNDQDEMFMAKKQKNRKLVIQNSIQSQNRKTPTSCSNKQNM